MRWSDIENLKNILLAHWHYLVIVLVSIIVYLPWFSWQIFTHSDWMFRFGQTLKEGLTASPWVANEGFGQPDLVLWRLPLNLLFGWLGADLNVADKFFVLWPVALLPGIASFILIRKLLNNPFAALIGSLVFSYNTFFLAINTQGHILITLGLTVSLLAFSTLIDVIEKRDWSKAFMTVLLITATGIFDLRALYLAVILCGMYTLYRLIVDRTLPWKMLVATGAGVAALNAFWILPSFFSGAILENEVLGRGLFGNTFWSLKDAASLHHPFWNGSKPEWFEVSPIPMHFWIIPIAAILGMIVQYKNSRVIFFGVLAVVGILLAKQVDQPFSSLYPWLFEYVPGFSAFREASKFYFFIALGYAVLIAALIQWLQQHWGNNPRKRSINYFVMALIVGTILWNIKPLTTGEIATMHEPRHIPQDYLVLKQFLLEQPDQFRTYWIPRDSRWGAYTNQHPKLSGINTVENLWKPYLKTDISNSKKASYALTELLHSPLSEKLLNSASIKYVIVPLQDIQSDDDFFKYYGQSRQDYTNTLDKVDYLQRINIGTRELVVYENVNYDPYISASDSLMGVDRTSSVDSAYAFLKSQNSQNTNFEIDATHRFSSNILKHIFIPYNLTASQLSNKLQLRDAYTTSNNSALLHKNLSSKILSYELSSQNIKFLTRPLDDIRLNGALVHFDQTPSPEVLVDTKLKSTKNIYLQMDDAIVPINESVKSQDIGNIVDYKTVNLLRADTSSLLNGSFGDGPWNEKVGDCHRYDENSQLNMKLDTEHYISGPASLRLGAARHHACASKEFDVAPGEYLLQLNYQSPNARQAGYFIEFNDPARTVVSERLQIESLDQWRSRMRRITVPEGANNARLYIYAYESSDSEFSIVRYDDISFRRLELLETVQLPSETNRYQAIETKLTAGKNIFEYISDEHNGTNLISNPSLEAGLWEEAVGDCHNYDNNADIKMQLVNDASHGKKSLELAARNHHACTKTDLDIKAWGSHILKFDYKGNTNALAGYYLQFNDAQQTVVSERLEVDKEAQWYTFGRKVKVPSGATGAHLYVYAYESGTATPNVVKYDNFSFVQSPDFERAYYLTQKGPSDEMQAPASVDFINVNPGQKIVRVRGATKNFMLNFAERYHKDWKLYASPFSSASNCKALRSFEPRESYLSNRASKVTECKADTKLDTGKDLSFWRQKPVFDSRHVALNNYANGWSIEPALIKSNLPQNYYQENADGSIDFELVVYFAPQSYLYIGIITSLVSLLVMIFLMLSRRYQTSSRHNVIYTLKSGVRRV